MGVSSLTLAFSGGPSEARTVRWNALLGVHG
jgi:hypothetical protein